MQPLHPFRRRRIDKGADSRARKRLVKCEVDLRDAGGSCEPPLVGRIIRSECADVVEGPRLESHDPIAGHEIWIGGIKRLVVENRFIKSRRKRVNEVDVAGELAVLLLGDASRDEDAKMTDRLMD